MRTMFPWLATLLLLVGCAGNGSDDDSASPGDDDTTGIPADDDTTGIPADDDTAMPDDDTAMPDDDAADDDTTAQDGPLAALWSGQAHFAVDQDPVPVEGSTSGHREAFAVNRTDIGAQTVFLYHRCFGQGSYDASICLSISHDGGDSFAEFVGEVVAPDTGHVFAVAPAVVQVNGTWTMVYEESNVAAVYWAESSDGRIWTPRGQLLDHGSGGEWDQGTLSTPGAMVTQSGTVYVYYSGFPTGGTAMSIGFASSGSMETLVKSAFNPVFGPSGSGWDGAHVSMGRPIQEDGWIYMAYEGADTDFTCEASNRYGWGMARSADGITWERHPGNPFGLSAQSPYGCGNDMPSIFERYDGEVFVYHTSDDTTRIVREHLVVDP